MNYVVSGEEMSRIDKYTIRNIGIPQLVLMERAALCVCDFICDRFDFNSKVLVVVESGNNGADGVAVARLLKIAGYDVSVYFINDLKIDNQAFGTQCYIAKNIGVRFIDKIADDGYGVVVDGIFGVGLNRDIISKHAEAVAAINDLNGYKIAIDIPTGIDSFTGGIHNCAVRADATITFGLMKMGLLQGYGPDYSGFVKVCDIGIPEQAIEYVSPNLYCYDENDLENLIPARHSDSHKGSYGRVAVIGGSNNMAGAALFAAEAAYRMGCGLVKICTVEENREITQIALPEALLSTYKKDDIASIKDMTEAVCDWADVIVIGPGMGLGEHSNYILNKILVDFKKTIVIDADGINALAENVNIIDKTDAEVIITPHLLEMSRLTDISVAAIKENKYEVAKEFAEKHNCVVVLKDSRTIVSDGSTTAYINITGNDGMATGGAGDVLCGIIAGLTAQKMKPYEAAKTGVYIHGLCGEDAAVNKGRHSVIARDIIKSITNVMEATYDAQ